MIVTEEEAKTKRCQESFGDHNVTDQGYMVAASQSYHMGGSVAIQTSPSMCIGSSCMAWRWLTLGYALDRTKGDMHSQGYCGKAGHP